MPVYIDRVKSQCSRPRESLILNNNNNNNNNNNIDCMMK